MAMSSLFRPDEDGRSSTLAEPLLEPCFLGGLGRRLKSSWFYPEAAAVDRFLYGDVRCAGCSWFAVSPSCRLATFLDVLLFRFGVNTLYCALPSPISVFCPVARPAFRCNV